MKCILGRWIFCTWRTRLQSLQSMICFATVCWTNMQYYIPFFSSSSRVPQVGMSEREINRKLQGKWITIIPNFILIISFFLLPEVCKIKQVLSRSRTAEFPCALKDVVWSSKLQLPHGKIEIRITWATRENMNIIKHKNLLGKSSCYWIMFWLPVYRFTNKALKETSKWKWTVLILRILNLELLSRTDQTRKRLCLSLTHIIRKSNSSSFKH